MRAAINAGLSIAEYEEMTPYQLNVYLEEYARKQREEAKERLILAYLTAAWVRVKRMPNLKKLLNQIDSPQPLEPMTPEQMLKRIKILNAILGGTVVEKKGGD